MGRTGRRKLRLDKFKVTYAPFDEIQDQIELLSEEDAVIGDRFEVENKYFDLLTKAEHLLRNLSV